MNKTLFLSSSLLLFIVLNSVVVVVVDGGFVQIFSGPLLPGEGHGYYFAAYSQADAPLLPMLNNDVTYVNYALVVSMFTGGSGGSGAPGAPGAPPTLPPVLVDIGNGTNGGVVSEVLVYHSSLRDKVGSGYSIWTGERNYCCTQQLFDTGVCSRVGVMNFNVSEDPEINGNLLFYKSLTFEQFNEQKTNITDRHIIEHTGVWYFAVANCDTLPGGITIEITGHAEFKNPFGYLGGESFGYLFVYWVFSLLYCVIALVWGITSYIYGKDLVIMQHILGFVVGVSVFENIIWACDYTLYNVNGIVHPVANIFGALFSSMKLTSIRLLVLLVALGFKIIRPTLVQKYKLGIIVLMIVYFIVEASQEYIAVAESAGEEIQNGLQWTMMFFLGTTEIVIFIWIGIEISKSFKNPNLIHHHGKYEMYRTMTFMTITLFSLSIIIALIEVILQVINTANANMWRYFWIFGTYWESVYFIVIVFMVWWWRPSGNNARYAYDQIPREREGREGVEGEMDDRQDDVALEEVGSNTSEERVEKDDKKKGVSLSDDVED